ncbi:hypothetical protein NFI96_009518, partial [Prochilodus magdalenae]
MFYFERCFQALITLTSCHPPERNDGNFLAMKLALEECGHWLEGARNPFMIVTDNKNLEYLSNLPPWITNTKADALSRIYEAEATSTLWILKTSDTEELQIQTVKYGENVTVKCDHDFVKGSRQHYVAWYKQSFGKQLQLIVRSSESSSDIRYAREFAECFRVTADEGKFDLSIINTVDEDTGTYFCVKLKDYAAEFGSGTLLLFTDEKSQQSDVTEVDVKRGESVTLQCSVARLSCSGEHSVYWYRHGSGEPHPGIIYTHGNTNSPCTRSSETDSSTQSCVYKLSKSDLSLLLIRHNSGKAAPEQPERVKPETLLQ